MVKGPVAAKILTNLQIASSESQSGNRVYTDPNAAEFLIDPPILTHLNPTSYSAPPSTSSKDQEQFSYDRDFKNVKICFDTLVMDESDDQKLIGDSCEDCFMTRSYSSDKQSKDAGKSTLDGKINEVCSSDKNQEKDLANENIDMNKSILADDNITTQTSAMTTKNPLNENNLNNNNDSSSVNFNDPPIQDANRVLSPVSVGIVPGALEIPSTGVALLPSAAAANPVAVTTTAALSLPPQNVSHISTTSGAPHHHHHHHVFPIHVISIPQASPVSAPTSATGATVVAGAWPLIETPIYVDSSVEPRHFCPAHSQGPGHREHRVLLQLDAGVSLPLQIAGKRKVFRGPTTVQMVSQNRHPPIPVPVQVPQGQVMQQYVNENGTLTHVVLSPAQYQQLHAGGGVPHIHAPFIPANGTTSHFYTQISTGFPAPGNGPHFHPVQPSGHLQPQQLSHSPHSPSPPSNYHKDERSQRQHTKLLKKLDQKREMCSNLWTPADSPSPRKNDLNGSVRRTIRNGTSSVGTSEDGEESSSVPDEEEDCQVVIDQLSNVQKPEVTNITSRTATLRWEAPPISENLINIRDLRYDVLLSDRGKERKYKRIFEGESYGCLIQDLKPGQEYFVCLQVHYEKLQGSASEPTVFTTPPCEPDTPAPPKLISRTKNALHLRWTAPNDNGSHIINYSLLCDEGRGKNFVEVVNTKGKQYTLSKLQPSTNYSLKLSAVNECGASQYSDIATYMTSGNPPPTPKPPTLKSTTSSTLLLAWERRNQDEEYILQMADRESGHGFLNMYSGFETSYECKGLKRATLYQFRLRADNEAGASSWSNEVTYKTLAERPGKPGKPQVKGKIHGTYFRARWDPPNDRGGAEISRYFFEISSGGKFEKTYVGPDAETICDRLSPGTTYQVRVSCEGPAGVSGYSEVSTITTEAVVPGQPEKPFCTNPPAPYAAVLRWEKPDFNGGAPILEYEMQLNGLKYHNSIVYRGKETFCVVKDLKPGEEYNASVRAVNRIGSGIWSETYCFKTGAAPPFAPEELEILVRSATHLTISWKEPMSNGAVISEYRLESSIDDDGNDMFSTCYEGLETATDLRNLIPFRLYYFRVCATNVAGTGPYSSIVSTKTPASVPGAPQIENSEFTANEVTLFWSKPEENGSEILYYIIEYSDKTICTEQNHTSYTVTKLLPETTYKFKVQAVNGIGAGQFSSVLKITTLPPPPEPPSLECTGIGHNYIKLKWGEGKNLDFVNYCVEMFNARTKQFQVVYSGTSLICKVNKLQELTSYRFRICAETEKAGSGDYSIEYIYKTCATPPSNIKPPRIVDIQSCNPNSNLFANYSSSSFAGNTGLSSTGSNGSVTIEWQQSRNSFTDNVEYILQYSSAKEHEYKVIYRGPETRYTINDLEPGNVYLFRVCPVRIMPNGCSMGVYTNPLRYEVPQKLSLDHSNSIQSASTSLVNHRSASVVGGSTDFINSCDDLAKHNILTRLMIKFNSICSSRKRFTDRETAIVWVLFFMIVAIFSAAVVRMLMR